MNFFLLITITFWLFSCNKENKKNNENKENKKNKDIIKKKKDESNRFDIASQDPDRISSSSESSPDVEDTSNSDLSSNYEVVEFILKKEDPEEEVKKPEIERNCDEYISFFRKIDFCEFNNIKYISSICSQINVYIGDGDDENNKDTKKYKTAVAKVIDALIHRFKFYINNDVTSTEKLLNYIYLYKIRKTEIFKTLTNIKNDDFKYFIEEIKKRDLQKEIIEKIDDYIDNDTGLKQGLYNNFSAIIKLREYLFDEGKSLNKEFNLNNKIEKFNNKLEEIIKHTEKELLNKFDKDPYIQNYITSGDDSYASLVSLVTNAKSRMFWLKNVGNEVNKKIGALTEEVKQSLKNILWDKEIISSSLLPILLIEGRILFLNEIINGEFYNEKNLTDRYSELNDNNKLNKFKILSSQAIFNVHEFIGLKKEENFSFKVDKTNTQIPYNSVILGKLVNLMPKMNNYITPFSTQMKDNRRYKDILKGYKDNKGNKITVSPEMENIIKEAIELCKKAVDDSFRRNETVKKKFKNSKNDHEKNKIVKEILDEITIKIRKQSQEFKDKDFVTNYSLIRDKKIKQALLEVIAQSFAWWTSNSSAKNYLEAYVAKSSVEDKDADKFVDSTIIKEIKMHQVIASILTLFSENTKSQKKILNQLIEIATGEGKSVIIGAVAVALANLGFDVFIANYSNTLVERDSNAFVPLFAALNLNDKIHYGTLDEIIELAQNLDVDIRKSVSSFLSKEKSLEKAHPTKNNRILIFDEVDSITNQDFGGKLSSQAFIHKNNGFTCLANHIWDEMKKNVPMREIKNKIATNEQIDAIVESLIVNKEKNTKEYIAELRKCVLMQVCYLITSADMVYKKKIKSGVDYLINIDKSKKDEISISYKDVDGFVDNILTYKSIFILKQAIEDTSNEAVKKLFQKKLESITGMIFSAGKYSYISAIQREFLGIVGYSGSLKNSNERQNDILTSMGIEQIGRLKSFYAHIRKINKTSITKKYIIADDDDEQKEKIIDKVKETLNKGGITVIVASGKKMENLYDVLNKATLPKLGEVLRLTANITFEKKNEILKKAGKVYNILLMEKIFNRGTDIVIDDPVVARSLGITYINTVPSEDKCEEIQSHGRVGRKDDAAEIIEIFSKRDLIETYYVNCNFTKLDEKIMNELYKTKATIDSPKIMGIMKEAEEKNRFSLEILNNIKKGSIENLPCKFFIEDNSVRIFVAVDASSSMDLVFTDLKAKLKTVQEELYRAHDARCITTLMFYSGAKYYKEHGFATETGYNHKLKNKLNIIENLQSKEEVVSEIDNIKEGYGTSNDEGILVALFALCMQSAIYNTSLCLLFGDDYFKTGNDMKYINNEDVLEYIINKDDIGMFNKASEESSFKKTFNITEVLCCQKNECSKQVIGLKYSKVLNYLKQKKCTINTFIVPTNSYKNETQTGKKNIKEVFNRIANDTNGKHNQHDNSSDMASTVIKNSFSAEIAKG